VTDTVFVLKEGHEYCFLFDRDDPQNLLFELLPVANQEDGGLTREETLEVLEGIISERLRSI
jgi:hypothetical protein